MYILGISEISSAQDVSDVKERYESRRLVLEGLKNLDTYGYDYVMTVKHDNGDVNTLHGSMYTDSKQKVMYNISTAFDIVYTKQWFLRADHEQKTISVIDLNKQLSDSARQLLEAELFSNQLYAVVIDSVLKHALIPKYSRTDSEVTVTLLVAKASVTPIRRVEISYDVLKHLPKRMVFHNFYPSGIRNAYSRSNVSQVIDCSNYTTHKDIDIQKYFTIKDGEVVLKKFKEYKLYKVL